MSVKRPTPGQIAQAAAFVREVIEKPWVAGAQGPDAYDCWGLVRAAQLRLAGRDLPIINADPADLRQVLRLIKDHPLNDVWVEVPKPQHLDVVELASSNHPRHLGVWLALDDGGVLHGCEQYNADGTTNGEKPGITFDGLLSLQVQGWSQFRFMRAPEVMA